MSNANTPTRQMEKARAQGKKLSVGLNIIKRGRRGQTHCFSFVLVQVLGEVNFLMKLAGVWSYNASWK